MEDVDLHNTLAHDIEEELGVVGALLRRDHVVHHRRSEKPDVLVRKLEERERGDSAGSIPEGNECSFPLQELEIIVEPVHGGQHALAKMNSEKKDVRVLSHTVKHSLHADAVRYFQHPLHGVLLGV